MYRNKENLVSLEWNQKLHDIAQEHSKNMALGYVPFSYEGLEFRFITFSPQECGFSENLALGPLTKDHAQ